MKNFPVFVLLVCLTLTVTGLLCAAEAPNTDYQLLFKDDFDGTTLNADFWSYRVGKNSGGENRIENVRVADGNLHLDYILRDGIYTGAGVISLDALGYGYYETTARTYNGANGFHSSFWTSGGGGDRVGTYYAKDPRMIEIDGFEFDTNQTGIAPSPYYNLHYWWTDHRGIGGKRMNIERDGDPETPDWFTMGFEYLPGTVIYYVNGEEVGRNPLDIYGAARVKLTGLAMIDKYTDKNGNINIDNSKADENGFFGSSEYQYFSYYQKKLKNVNLLGNGHFEFNRQNSLNPKCFYFLNDVQTKFSPFAYDGYCFTEMRNKSEMGQKFPHLLSGKYTFGGYFKTSEGTNARLVVYDKNGDELKSIPIPDCNEWTYVSISDIGVSDYALPLIETQSGVLWVDNITFFSQDGDDSFENYQDSDYKNYSAFANDDSYTILTRDDTERSNHEWNNSSAAGIENYYVYASSNPNNNAYYKDIWVKYTIPIKEDKWYDLELTRVLYNNNPPSQIYTIKLDGVEICAPVTVETYSKDNYSDLFKLCTFEAKKGQTLEVTMNSGDFSSTGTKCVRALPLQLVSHDSKLLESSLVFQVENPIFMYKNSPYAFDKSNSSLVPYKENDEIYIPYQAIKDKISISGISDDSKYITVSQISSDSKYKIEEDNSLLVVYESDFIATKNTCDIAFSKINRVSGALPAAKKDAVFVGTTSAVSEEIYTMAENCRFYKTWATNSSIGYNNKSYYSTDSGAQAVWSFFPKKDGEYSVQIYSASYDGKASNSRSGTTNAGLELTVGRSYFVYSLNQCSGNSGWYDLGTLKLTKDTPVTYSLYNISNDGDLRASAVRLVPVHKTKQPVFVGNTDMDGQIEFSFNSAQKEGLWKGSSGELSGCFYGASSPSVTWTVTAPEEKSYSLHVYNPCLDKTSTSSDTKVTFTLNGEQYFWILNQRLPTADNTGWYYLGVFDLTPQSVATLKLEKGSASYLRAKSIRLVPLAETPSADKLNGYVIVNSGKISNQNSTVIYKEKDLSGRPVQFLVFEKADTFTKIPMLNPENNYKLFFWENINSMIPVVAPYSNK